MRVLLMVKKFDFGGAENHVCDLATGLAEINNEVWIASPSGKRLRELHPSVRHYPIHYLNTLVPFLALRLAKLVIRRRINVIHAHQRLPILVSCWVSLLTRVPVVATIHGRWRHEVRSHFVKQVLRQVIFVSGFSLRTAQSNSTLSRKAVLIPNGVNHLPQQADNFMPFRLLYASRLSRSHTKFISMIIKKVIPPLLRRYPLLELEIAGDGSSLEILYEQADVINTREGRKVVRFLGYQPNIFRAISRAALILGVGRVALESLSQGAPVLIVNNAHLGLPLTRKNFEAIRYNNFIAVEGPPPTPNSIGEAITEIIDNFTFYKSEAEALKGTVLKEHNLARITEKVVRTYRDLPKPC